MFACLLFGDSLALGAGAAVNTDLAHPCDVQAATGAGSRAIARWVLPPRRYDTVILSLGSNDDLGEAKAATRRAVISAAMASVRARMPGARVIWLLPYDRRRAYVVRSVAMTFGDEVLDLARFPSRDRLHPIDYRALARALLR